MPPQGAKAVSSPFRGYLKTGPSGPGFLLNKSSFERMEGTWHINWIIDKLINSTFRLGIL